MASISMYTNRMQDWIINSFRWCVYVSGDWFVAYDIQSLLHSDEVDNSTYQDIKSEMEMSTNNMTCVYVIVVANCAL